METTMMPHDICVNIIQQQKQKEEIQDIWKNSPYKDLAKLQSNNVGNVGEQLIGNICKLSNIAAMCDGSKTKRIGGGEGDGTIMDMVVEIKTACQGSSSSNFQHELAELPWKPRYMMFVDISPDCIYLTIFKNFDEETYKSKGKLPYCFPTKTVTWRKEKGAFKLDTTVNINEKNIEAGYTIKIIPSTTNEEVASFIRKMIV
jgi:hypothetical protein